MPGPTLAAVAISPSATSPPLLSGCSPWGRRTSSPGSSLFVSEPSRAGLSRPSGDDLVWSEARTRDLRQPAVDPAAGAQPP
jgi:hypothetical protein